MRVKRLLCLFGHSFTRRMVRGGYVPCIWISSCSRCGKEIRQPMPGVIPLKCEGDEVLFAARPISDRDLDALDWMDQPVHGPLWYLENFVESMNP